MANAWLWQIIERETINNTKRTQCESALREHPRIQAWAAWPHAMVRRFEHVTKGSLHALGKRGEEMIARMRTEQDNKGAARDFERNSAIRFEVQDNHVRFIGADGDEHVMVRKIK